MRDIESVEAGAQQLEVSELISPIVRFLRASGVAQETLEAAIRSEYRRRHAGSKSRRVKRVGINNQCARLIANWKVLPRFLDHSGYPRDLHLRGAGGFLELAKISAQNVEPMLMLRVLQQYGAIAKTRSGRLRLKTKVFICKTPAGRVVAFEPNVQFITDAARVVDDQLRGSGSRGRSRGLYWRMVDNHWVPAKHIQAFIAFSKRRTMMLMEEIEDWLDEHEATGGSKVNSNLARLGIGLFTITERSKSGRLFGQR